MTVLSSSYGIIMNCEINAPGHGNNASDGLNATDKRYFKEEMELIGLLVNNDTINIGILPSASKYVSISFSDQCLHVINNKERFNGFKGRTKMQKIPSQFKYKSRIYNVQRNSGVNHRGMKMRWNKKPFSYLNYINDKTSPSASKVNLRHYYY